MWEKRRVQGPWKSFPVRRNDGEVFDIQGSGRRRRGKGNEDETKKAKLNGRRHSQRRWSCV